MKVKLKNFFMLVIIWIWLGSMAAFGDSGVWDNADLFDSSEESKLSELCKEASKDMGIDVLIYTAADMEGSSGIQRLVADKYKELNADNRGIMLLIEMSQRWVIIREGAAKEAAYRYADSDLEIIQNDTIASIKSTGSYYQAAKVFVDDAKDYLASGFYSKSGKFVKASTLVIVFIVCVVIGGIVVLFMYLGQKSSKVTDGRVYMRGSGSPDILEQDDIYTHTTRQVIHHERSHSSGGGGGGGGGGHSSSGGHF